MPPVPPVIDEHPGNARDEEAIGVSSGSEEEVGPEGERQDSPARWSKEEIAILDRYLPRYKESDKAGRMRLLTRKVLKKMKPLYNGSNWSERKQVSSLFYHGEAVKGLTNCSR